jgi:hypothetical protein
MRHFATLTLPDGVYACTANPDGSIPLSSREVARASAHDKDGASLRYLVEQANAASALAEALRDVVSTHEVTQMPGVVDYSGFHDAMMNARAALARAGELQ